MFLEGYAKAVFFADINTKRAPSRDLLVDRFRRIRWEDATDEQKENLLWVKYDKTLTAHLPLTEAEQEQIKKNDAFHKDEMYKYLLSNYGVDYADRFAKHHMIKTDLPQCAYTHGQCNLLCDYFKKGKCSYES